MTEVEDLILAVDAWRTSVPNRTARPTERSCDAAQHILLMCRTAGIQPTSVDFSAAESVVIVFALGALYCDVEVESDGSIQAVAPGGSSAEPIVWTVPDTDEAITATLMRIHAYMTPPDKIPGLGL